ncbi:hypothetical protein [Streptomyces sp. NPDC050121]|uniref:hypothetical protein n=1 Tax=Streptomyces sp. NPDC050121 TaxID=3365601 RepID=UPI00378FED83
MDWRRRLVSWMFGLARHKAHDGIPYDEWNDAWQRVGVNGLPGDLTWEEFVAASSRYRHSQNMAGTRPLELLTWSGEGWLLPRAYIELLDRWAQREEELVNRARVCSSCGVQGPYWDGWRTSTSKGYVTRARRAPERPSGPTPTSPRRTAMPDLAADHHPHRAPKALGGLAAFACVAP